MSSVPFLLSICKGSLVARGSGQVIHEIVDWKPLNTTMLRGNILVWRLTRRSRDWRLGRVDLETYEEYELVWKLTRGTNWCGDWRGGRVGLEADQGDELIWRLTRRTGWSWKTDLEDEQISGLLTWRTYLDYTDLKDEPIMGNLTWKTSQSRVYWPEGQVSLGENDLKDQQASGRLAWRTGKPGGDWPVGRWRWCRARCPSQPPVLAGARAWWPLEIRSLLPSLMMARRWWPTSSRR